MNDKEIPLFNKDRDRFYKRMSNEQHVMFDSILEVPFTFVEAKAGSGKTTVAFAAGIDMLIMELSVKSSILSNRANAVMPTDICRVTLSRRQRSYTMPHMMHWKSLVFQRGTFRRLSIQSSSYSSQTITFAV